MTHEQALELAAAMIGEHNDKAPELRAAIQAMSPELDGMLCENWWSGLRLFLREKVNWHTYGNPLLHRWKLGLFLVEWGLALLDCHEPEGHDDGSGLIRSLFEALLKHRSDAKGAPSNEDGSRYPIRHMAIVVTMRDGIQLDKSIVVEHVSKPGEVLPHLAP